MANDSIQRQYSNPQMQESKIVKDYNYNKTLEGRNAKETIVKESLGNKGSHRKTSNDIKLEMGPLTKQYGKYNKVNMNHNTSSFGKISANNMTWSMQQSNYSNSMQRSFQPKSSFGQLQNQTQVSDIMLTLLRLNLLRKYCWKQQEMTN